MAALEVAGEKTAGDRVPLMDFPEPSEEQRIRFEAEFDAFYEQTQTAKTQEDRTYGEDVWKAARAYSEQRDQ